MEGVQVRGEIAEVWQSGRQIGTLWDWQIDTDHGAWEGAARKQSFSEAFRGGEVEVRFLLTASSSHVFQMRGLGELDGVRVGMRCREEVRMNGYEIRTMTGRLSIEEETGWTVTT